MFISVKLLAKYVFIINAPWIRFSKVPIINGPGKLLLFTFKIEVSIVLQINSIKLSVNKTKRTGLSAISRAFTLHILIRIYNLGPEKLPGLSRNGLQVRKRATAQNAKA